MQGPSSYFPAGQSYVFPNEIKDLHDSDYEFYHPIPAHGASTPLRMGIEEAKPVAALDVSHAAGEEEDQLLHLLQHHLPVQVPAVVHLQPNTAHNARKTCRTQETLPAALLRGQTSLWHWKTPQN